MRKLFGGVVALALAATGSLALAAPGSTQEEPPVDLRHLDANLSPTEAAPGDDVTVTPVENCSVETGYLIWLVFEAGEFSFDEGSDPEVEPVLVDVAELNEDGSWEVVFPAPGGPDVDDEALQAFAEENPIAIDVYGPEAFTSGDVAYEWFAQCVEIELPELVHLDADLTQTGDAVAVTPVDNCSATEGFLDWLVYPAGEFSWDDFGGAEPVGGGFVDLEAGGSWQLEFSAAEAVAGFPEEGEDFAAAAAAAEDEEPYVVEVYGPEAFTSGGADYEWFAQCVEFVEPPFLEAEITSHEAHTVLGFPLVNQGDEITVGPIDPCPATSDGSLFWEVDSWPLDDEEPEMIDAGYLDVADDGTWELKFPTPDDGDDVKVTFYAVWLDCETTDEVTGFYDLLLFAVGEAPATPPTEEPTEPVGPKPAHPVVRTPDQTG
ncbi:MAG TPA: hypothetical protein VK611_30750 [Acidimicrobiales bacterium]|nr:hypothetical protein [Acidimicrobiales bacterium]